MITNKFRLYNNDCLEIMKELPKHSIDMILTDPPYAVTASSWDIMIPFDKMWEQINRIIKPKCAIILFGLEPFSSALRLSNLKNYKYDWVWNKKSPSNQMLAKKQPLRIVENIMVFNTNRYYPQGIIPFNDNKCFFEEIKPIKRKGKQGTKITDNIFGGGVRNKEYDQENKNYPKNILTFSKDKPSLHSTQKPVALGQYLIRTYSKKGEVVLDFTAGSGSFGVSALRENRKFIGIEKETKYYATMKERIEKETKTYF